MSRIMTNSLEKLVYSVRVTSDGPIFAQRRGKC
jgi:hypothetical protein